MSETGLYFWLDFYYLGKFFYSVQNNSECLPVAKWKPRSHTAPSSKPELGYTPQTNCLDAELWLREGFPIDNMISRESAPGFCFLFPEKVPFFLIFSSCLRLASEPAQSQPWKNKLNASNLARQCAPHPTPLCGWDAERWKKPGKKIEKHHPYDSDIK